MIDLGTLGGNSAYPFALNDRGQVVGMSMTAEGVQHAFLWDSGGIHDLGHDLGSGFPASIAQAITNSGTIAGVGLDEGDGYHVLVWTNGVVRNLGQVHGGAASQVVAVTAAGDVVAWATDYLEWSAIWQGGVKQDLGGLISDHAEARAMNFSRQIVGSSFMNEVGGDSWINHPFIWQEGVMRDLGVLADYPCDEQPSLICGGGEAVDVNNQGVAVGSSSGADRQQHAVLWANGSIRDLGLGQAVAINSGGDVIGHNDRNAVFWRDGTMVVLDSLAGSPTRPVDLNDQGLITGYSMSTGGRPHVVVWHAGQPGITDLGTGPAGVQGDGAVPVAMNTRGDIIGYSVPFTCDAYGCRPQGPTRAILWRVKQ